MARTLILPALMLIAPTALMASPQPQTHEVVRMPAGKTVMLWRQVNRQNSAVIKCHPDSTKAFLCNGRTSDQNELAATPARAERLSER